MARPLDALLLARLREFFREPEAIFWVYGFPVLLAVGLGIAFRDKPPERVRVDVQLNSMGSRTPGDPAVATLRSLGAAGGFVTSLCLLEDCHDRLRLGRTDIVVVPGASVTYLYDPTRPESVLVHRVVVVQPGASLA